MSNEIIENNKPELNFGYELDVATELKDDIFELDRKVNNLIDNFIGIGFYLNKIKENKFFKDLGFEDIYDFAYSKYKMSKTTCKNMIAVSNKFSNKNLHYPEIDKKYSEYSFSQLVELVPEDENNLNNYSPEQTIKEMRITKFSKNIHDDEDKIVNWFRNDLLKFLKSKYNQCEFNDYFDLYSSRINIIYKSMNLDINLDSNKLINICSYDLEKLFQEETIFSIKLIDMSVNRFIIQVDKEVIEDVSINHEDIVSGPTSDQIEYDSEQEYYEDCDGLYSELDSDYIESSIKDDEDHHEEKGVITIKEKVITVTSKNQERKQILKNEKQRIEYIRNIDNYNLLYDLKEVNARIYQMKEIPCIYEIQYFGKFYYTDEATWKHAEYHFLNPNSTKDFGYCMFKSTSCSISVLADYLKQIKF